MKNTLLFIATSCLFFLLNSCASENTPIDYKGIPFSDSQYQTGSQTLPGLLQCEYYDQGGEGIAFHDSDSLNSGSGALNPADGTYLHEFRMDEPVDISFTKADGIDNNDYNLVRPEMEQLYVGWTNPGEWTKYTVDVKEDGLFEVDIMYTANADGQISISVNDIDVTGPIDISSTYAAADSIPWRQWHHWNKLKNVALVELKKGKQIITLHTVETGQMNYDYLDFRLIK